MNSRYRPAELIIGVWMALIGAIFSSSKAVIIKLAYLHGINAESLLTLRMLFAFPFFLILGIWAWQRKKVTISTRTWAGILLVGLLGYYLASLFDFIGLEYITAGLERLIVFAYPTIVVLLGRLFWKRPISLRQWLALILTYVGIFMALKGDVKIPEPDILWTGAAWVFACAVAYSLHLLGSETLIPKTGVMMFSSWAMIGATGGVLVHALVNLEHIQLTGYPDELYWLVVLLALITTILPPYLMSGGIQRLGAGNAAILGSIGPVSTLILAWWLLEERLSFMQMAGAAIVLSGVVIISRKKSKEK